MARLPDPAIESLLSVRLSSAMVPSSIVLCFRLLAPRLALPDELLDDPCNS